MPRRERNQPVPLENEKGIGTDQQRSGLHLDGSRERNIDFAFTACAQNAQLLADAACRILQVAQLHIV